MIELLKKYAALIASCGPAGYWPLGMFIGSLVAYPLLWFFTLLGSVAPVLAGWLVVLLLVVGIGSVLLVLGDQQVPLVADKVVGLMLAHVAIPLTFKLMVLSYLGFYGVRWVAPLIISRFVHCDIHEKLGLWCVLISSLVAGVVVNLLLQAALWVGR
jgi:hypothetical protein